jgi:hypothetical protein
MKKLLFFGFFLGCIYCFSQNVEEDVILDDVLDELFRSEDLLLDRFSSHYLYANFSYDESVFFAGRDFDIDQFGFTPSVSYMRGKNFFVSMSSAYFSELDPKWDFVSISSGYSLFLDQMENLSLTGVYSRIFFNDDAEELNPNRFSLALAFQKNKLRMRLSGGYLFGGSTSFYTSAGASYEIQIVGSDQWDVNISPQLSFLMSEQTVSEQISSGLFNTQTLERDVFDLINTQLSFPLELDTGNWDFQLSYNINFPKALASEHDLSTSGFISFSVGYFSSL